MSQAPSSSSYLLCGIGDSRTFGAGATIGFDPLTLTATLLEQQHPSSRFLTCNRGINGTTSQHWLYATILAEALAAFQECASTHPDALVYVQLMLGFNDATGIFGRFSLEAYLAHMQGIIAQIQAATIPRFSGIILHTSYYAVPYGFAPEIDEFCLSEVLRFNAALPSLADGRNVLMGDTDAYALFEQHPELMFDKLHASNEGNAALAALWARVYERILFQAVDTVMGGR